MKKNTKQEITRLFDFAQIVSKHDLQLAREIIFIARKLAMKTRSPLPRRVKRTFCRKCNTPYSTKTVRIRIGVHHPQITYACKICGHTKRFPYHSKKRTR